MRDPNGNVTPSDTDENRRNRSPGEIANELRSIYQTLNRSGWSGEARIAEAKEKVEALTHDLEEQAWGETKPMDHTPSGSDLNTEV